MSIWRFESFRDTLDGKGLGMSLTSGLGYLFYSVPEEIIFSDSGSDTFDMVFTLRMVYVCDAR